MAHFDPMRCEATESQEMRGWLEGVAHIDWVASVGSVFRILTFCSFFDHVLRRVASWSCASHTGRTGAHSKFQHFVRFSAALPSDCWKRPFELAWVPAFCQAVSCAKFFKLIEFIAFVVHNYFFIIILHYLGTQFCKTNLSLIFSTARGKKR